MLSILKDIPDFALSCELNDFTIMADKTVTILFSKDGRELFSANYVPDANKEIHFRDLCSIIEPYLMDEPMQRFHYRVSADSEQMIVKNFDVLLCRYGISEAGASFVQNHFLTSLLGRKLVNAASTEFLYLTNPTTTSALTDDVNAACVYVTPDNQVVKENKTVNCPGVIRINKVDVSPRLFQKPDMTLVRYTITAGARTMRYDVAGAASSVSIRFKNNFGCVETFTFGGSVEIDPKIERSAAVINGDRVNYDIRKETHYKCYSSYIPTEMLFFADDIAASADVSFVTDEQQFPVAVVESETNRSNSTSELYSFWIEFVSASRVGFMLPELTRIFDDTFDKSYN